jgi:RecA/RadA recombinase
MAAKKTTAKKAPPPKAKPSFKAPTARAAAGGGEHEAEEGFPGPVENSRSTVDVRQLGISKDLLQANREFAAAMNKDGRKRVVMANDAPNVYELRRPTGILKLDADIGGGFPAGGLSIIAGPDNAGKSYLVLKTMALHQRLYGQLSNLAYGQVEGAFDFKRALQIGLVISVPDEILSAWSQENVQIGLPPLSNEQILWCKRQIGGFEILRGTTGEETMHVVNEAVKFNRFSIIGVDSFSVLLPEADEDKDVGAQAKRAGNATLMTDFFKKYTPNTTGINDVNPTTVIGIMQVRANPDKASNPYAKAWSVSGAYATRHGKLIDVQIWDGQKLRRTVRGQTVIYGKTLHWNIEKGKVGCHDNVTGSTEFLYGDPENPVSYTGHDDTWHLINLGVAHGVFIESGGMINVINPITRQPVDLRSWFPGEKEWWDALHDYNALYTTLSSYFELELSMRHYVLAALGVKCLYRPLA